MRGCFQQSKKWEGKKVLHCRKKANLSNSPARWWAELWFGGRAGNSSGASSAQELLYIPFASETFVQVFQRMTGLGQCCRQAWPQSYRNNQGSSIPLEKIKEVKAIIPTLHLRGLIHQLLPLPGCEQLNLAAELFTMESLVWLWDSSQIFVRFGPYIRRFFKDISTQSWECPDFSRHSTVPDFCLCETAMQTSKFKGP